jgi:hypothetical protein
MLEDALESVVILTRVLLDVIRITQLEQPQTIEKSISPPADKKRRYYNYWNAPLDSIDWAGCVYGDRYRLLLVSRNKQRLGRSTIHNR